MSRLLLAAIMIGFAAAPGLAQESGSISPGMTIEQVTAVLGPPLVTREQGEWTYLFFSNDCLPGCGSDDVVFLRQGEVVSAVFRGQGRRFTGGSANAALQPHRGSATRVGGVRVEGSPAGSRSVDLGTVRGAPFSADDYVRRDSVAGDTVGMDTAAVDTAPIDTVPRGPIPAADERRDLLRDGNVSSDSARLRQLRSDTARVRLRPTGQPPRP